MVGSFWIAFTWWRRFLGASMDSTESGWPSSSSDCVEPQAAKQPPRLAGATPSIPAPTPRVGVVRRSRYPTILATSTAYPRQDPLQGKLDSSSPTSWLYDDLDVRKAGNPAGVFWASRHLCPTGFLGSGIPQSSITHAHTDDDLRNWITHEAQFGHRKIFDQLGPVAGAAEGLVIAAPSTQHPDYFYTWTRAIVTGSIMDRLAGGENELEASLRLYAYSQASLQKTCNPSGCPANGGLGEPKFNVDGTPFLGSWGRPQRDGPALRAITLIRFANYLLDRGTDADRTFVSRFLYNQDTTSGNSVIKNDLEYTSHLCFDVSFDLWEEKPDMHFFTLVVCRKALLNGAALATRLGDSGAAAWYSQQFNVMTSRILDSGMFHFDDGSYRAYANPGNHNRKGIDSAVLLAILAGGASGDPHFGPAAPAVLASVKVYVDAFRGKYSIANSTGQVNGTDPVPTGRYPEDKWDGYETTDDTLGNPWYICTVAVPHLIDWAVAEFQSAGNITITDVSLPFFRQFESVGAGVLTRGDPKFATIIAGMQNWSNGFYAILRQFQGPGGVLYEQFNKNTGEPQGAPNLTWSFAAFANAGRARHNLEAVMN
ncbi:Glucoamylase [Ceratobasidium theobromae]|uniref:glucan 1,4-alpha-glucosidase n=1 Tax=Ceratobasidium theobromae TaxID=1582974 RepID=A0A5N5QL51_9AGAM|nr:Glucoamylase [Ceratobasidium theobromae]